MYGIVGLPGDFCQLLPCVALLFLEDLPIVVHDRVRKVNAFRAGGKLFFRKFSAVQQMTPFHVFFLQQFARQVTELSRHIPCSVVLEALRYEAHEPFQFVGILLHSLKKSVDGLGKDVLVVDFHFEACGESYLVCQVGKERLEEGVDGADVELVVVVNERIEGCACPSADFVGRNLCRKFGLHGFEETVGIVIPEGQGVEVLQDASLHFRRSLVGKGDGKLVLVGIVCALADEVGDECGGKREGLSRTGRGFVDGKQGLKRISEE